MTPGTRHNGDHGQGYPIIAGSASSGVGLQVAPLAAENKVLFISGPAATDGLTGINKYTFRSGRQSYQDIKTAASFLGDVQGKKVTVFAQDNAFGQANVASVTAVFGAGGATVTPLLVPATATDLVPFAKQAADADADLLFVAWAGTNATQMWDSLNQQGAFDKSTVVTGLDITPTHAVLAPVAADLSLLAHYFDGATDNEAEKALVAGLAKKNATQDLFSPDGFNAALMVAHAAESSPDDVDGMVTALEGWQFDGAEGRHADSRRGSRAAAADVPGQAGRCQRHADPGTGHGTHPGRDGSAGHPVQVSEHRTEAAAAAPGDVITRDGGPAVSVQDLGWTIGGAVILADISLEIARGELLAVIGPNGAGKSSLVNMISGVSRPTSRSDSLGWAGCDAAAGAVARSGRDRPNLSDLVVVRWSDHRAERGIRAAVRVVVPVESVPASHVRRHRGRGAGHCWSGSVCGTWLGRRPRHCPTATSASSNWRSRWQAP